MFLINSFAFNFICASIILPISYHGLDYIALLYPFFLFRLIKQLKNLKLKSRIFWGLSHSFINGLLGFYWIYFVIHDFGQIGFIPSVICSLFFVILLPCYNLILPFLIPAFPVFAMATSEFLPRIFPWYIGARLGDPFIQLGEYVGVHGLTILCVLASAIFFTRLRIYGSLLFYLLWFGFGFYLKPNLLSNENFIRVGIVQPNVGNFEKLESEKSVFETQMRILNKFFQFSPTNTDLVIWPETSFPTYYPNSRLSENLNEWIKNDLKTNLLFGAYSKKDETYQSTAYFVGPDAEIKAEFIKHRMLIFGEYLPKSLEFIREYVPGIGDMVPGPLPKAKQVLEGNLVVSTCLDGIHPWDFQDTFKDSDTVNRWNLHINLTNDSWYGPTIERFQHLNLQQMRAIELRTPLVRVTNNGISALVLQDGKVYQQTPINEESVPTWEVPLVKRSLTVFEKMGFHLVLILCFICLVFDFFSIFLSRQKKT